MKRIILLAALLLISTPAFAQCVSVDAEREAAVSHGGVVTALEGVAVKEAEKLFNAIPPESSNVVHTALVIDMPDGRGVLAVGPFGAICARVVFDKDMWRRARALLVGIEA